MWQEHFMQNTAKYWYGWEKTNECELCTTYMSVKEIRPSQWNMPNHDNVHRLECMAERWSYFVDHYLFAVSYRVSRLEIIQFPHAGFHLTTFFFFFSFWFSLIYIEIIISVFLMFLSVKLNHFRMNIQRSKHKMDSILVWQTSTLIHKKGK